MNNLNQNFELLNTFIDSISVIDNKGEIIYTNDAWRKFSQENNGDFSKTDSGVNYLKLCKKVTGEELQNATEAAIGIEKVIKKESPFFELEYPCHSRDEQRWFIMRANPLFSCPELTLISHVNITKRKLAETKVEKINNQLKVVNERLTTTTYKIVHDIQGPLNSIEGLVNLSKTDEQNKSISPYLSLIEKSVNNLKNYIQETLKISASGSKIESIDFNDILNTFFESIKHTPILKTIAIKMDVNQNHDFYTDKTEVASIISNLINNSLKYYDAKKTDPFVSISITVNEKDAIISIKDNGIGISKEIISHIFELNFQENKKSNTGSGIGLFMVNESIKTINGDIKVHSTLSEGTEFIITLKNLIGGK